MTSDVVGMKVFKVCKVGKSLHVTLPKEFVESHGIKEGDQVIVYYDGRLVIEPVRKEAVERVVRGRPKK